MALATFKLYFVCGLYIGVLSVHLTDEIEKSVLGTVCENQPSRPFSDKNGQISLLFCYDYLFQMSKSLSSDVLGSGLRGLATIQAFLRPMLAPGKAPRRGKERRSRRGRVSSMLWNISMRSW